ncbi:MAG: subclass B3 metallo-beta-lactamase [Terricaulis sp.]
MRMFMLAALMLAACAAKPAPALAPAPDPIDAAANAPVSVNDQQYVADIAPFQVMGNLYYVGTEGVSSFLITTPQGHILIDGGIAQTAPIIERHLAELGFSIRGVKYLLNTHAHYDHAAGLAQLKRDSGATFAASAGDRPILEAGRISYGPSSSVHYPPVHVDRVIADGDTITLGGVTLTAHLTPGHTPGCTSWSLDVQGADGAPHHAFIDCSQTVAGQQLAPESYPGMVSDYRASFAKVRAITADIFLASHGSMFDLDAKRAHQLAGDANAFVDPNGLHAYSDAMEAAFNAELAREQH